MKKIYKSTFAFLLCLGIISTFKAQVSAYSFTQNSGIYNAISGGTVVATATANTNAGSMDDFNYAANAIPFTFMFNGIGYTNFIINSNGYLVFGTAGATTNYFPISGTGAYAGCISAWGGDINSMFSLGTSSLTGSIRYEVFGVSPNRQAVIQFANFRTDYGNSTTDAYKINFQIYLEETTNKISIVYGPNSFAAGTTAANGAKEIGLRGALNTDYNNRLNATTVLFGSSVSGTVNTSSQAHNTALTTPGMPTSGLVYVFTPPAPPACPAPTQLTNTALAPTTASFSWTAGGSETNWDIYYGASPLTIPTPTTAPTTTVALTTVNLSGLSAASPYSIYVRAKCGVGNYSNWSLVTNFNTPCLAVNVPYLQDFETVTVPALPACTTIQNVGTGNNWVTNSPAGTSGFNTKALTYIYNSTNAANAWFYTQGLNLVAGTAYRLSYNYANRGTTFPENLKVSYGMSPNATAMTTTLTNHPSILTGTITNNFVDFTPSTTGVYYVGFNAYSLSNEFYLYVDDIIVDLKPACVTTPVAGVISGPATVNYNSVNSYSISPSAGNLQWYSSATTTGTWAAIAGSTGSITNITASTAGTVYYNVIASSLGCPNDTANVAFAVSVAFTGNDVCDAIPLTMGVSTLTFVPMGANVQVGEVVPPNTGLTSNTGWGANLTLNNTIWFSFTAPASGHVSVQSPGFDTQLALWNTSLCSFLLSAPNATLVAANDDDANYTTHNGAQYSSYLTAACLTPGVTYYIQLDSYAAATINDSTTIVITDLGTLDASFTGLAANYCTIDGNATLTPATIGGLFTVNTSTNAITAFSPSVTGVGTFTVSYALQGCVTKSVTNVAVCSGLKSLTKNEGVLIYPNPTIGEVTIELNNIANNTTFEAYDVIGKLMIKEILTKEKSTINISKLNNGIYIYKLLNENKIIKTGSLIKE